jgi:hypothetical protein
MPTISWIGHKRPVTPVAMTWEKRDMLTVTVSDSHTDSKTRRRAFWTASSPLPRRMDLVPVRFGILVPVWRGCLATVNRGKGRFDPLPSDLVVHPFDRSQPLRPRQLLGKQSLSPTRTTKGM